MFISINLEKVINEDFQKSLQNTCNEELRKILNENDTLIKEIVRDCIKGQIKSSVIEVLQSKEYRQIMTKNIMQIVEDKWEGQ